MPRVSTAPVSTRANSDTETPPWPEFQRRTAALWQCSHRQLHCHPEWTLRQAKLKDLRAGNWLVAPGLASETREAMWPRRPTQASPIRSELRTHDCELPRPVALNPPAFVPRPPRLLLEPLLIPLPALQPVERVRGYRDESPHSDASHLHPKVALRQSPLREHRANPHHAHWHARRLRLSEAMQLQLNVQLPIPQLLFAEPFPLRSLANLAPATPSNGESAGIQPGAHSPD